MIEPAQQSDSRMEQSGRRSRPTFARVCRSGDLPVLCFILEHNIRGVGASTEYGDPVS